MSFQNTIVAVISISMLYFVVAQAPQKCRGVDIQINEEKVIYINECLNASGVATVKEITKEQNGCFVKCVMLKQGMVDDSGMVLKYNIPNTLFGLPDSVKDSLITQIEQCFDKIDGKIDMDDKTCATFSMLCPCIRGAYNAACK